jgi:hypothetical protein
MSELAISSIEVVPGYFRIADDPSVIKCGGKGELDFDFMRIWIPMQEAT